MKQRVGFMGLGMMGSAMAANIAKAGYRLTVFNRTKRDLSELDSLGAIVAPSPRLLAQESEITIAMVTGPDALLDLLWGPEGAASAFEAGKIFINMSTVSPIFTNKLAQKLAGTGVLFVDAPVLGSKRPAEEGTLLILAGGNKDLVERLDPLFTTMGKKVVYCGQVGQGAMMNSSVNLLLGIMMEGFAETVHFGLEGGLPLDTLLEVIFSGPLSCALYQMKADMLRNDSYLPNFPLRHMTKDLKFVVDTAYEKGVPVPAGQTALQLYRMGVGQGWGDLDFAAIVKVLDLLDAKDRSRV